MISIIISSSSCINSSSFVFIIRRSIMVFSFFFFLFLCFVVFSLSANDFCRLPEALFASIGRIACMAYKEACYYAKAFVFGFGKLSFLLLVCWIDCSRRCDCSQHTVLIMFVVLCYLD